MNPEHVAVSLDQLDLFARHDPAKRRSAAAEQDDAGMTRQVSSLVQLKEPLLIEAVDIAAVHFNLAHPGPFGFNSELSAVLLRLEADRRRLDSHREVLGHQRDGAPFSCKV